MTCNNKLLLPDKFPLSRGTKFIYHTPLLVPPSLLTPVVWWINSPSSKHVVDLPRESDIEDGVEGLCEEGEFIHHTTGVRREGGRRRGVW